MRAHCERQMIAKPLHPLLRDPTSKTNRTSIFDDATEAWTKIATREDNIIKNNWVAVIKGSTVSNPMKVNKTKGKKVFLKHYTDLNKKEYRQITERRAALIKVDVTMNKAGYKIAAIKLPNEQAQLNISNLKIGGD